MKIDIITIFPELVEPFLTGSIVGRANTRGIIEAAAHDLRSFTHDRHKTVDDTPFGGGPGMVMKPEPWFAALESITGAGQPSGFTGQIIQPSPRGEVLDQSLLEELTQCPHLVFACGRYEDIDDRVRQHWQTREISLGDYVLNGGELAAMAIVEGTVRLLPGAIGDADSAAQDSFSTGLLDHRHFTKPRDFKGYTVPEVLLSGNHQKIRTWRLKDALTLTYRRRPELLEDRKLTEEERTLLQAIAEDTD